MITWRILCYDDAMKRKERPLPPAPGDLWIVQAFLNTVDRKARTDELASPRALAGWLAEQERPPADGEITAADVERVVAFRESLRSFLIAGTDADRELIVDLDAAVSSALLRARFTSAGKLSFESAPEGADGVIAYVLASLASAQDDGLLPRFKVCASTICRNAFYDYSTNRSGKWCRPLCGNRLSARASQRRARRRWKKILA